MKGGKWFIFGGVKVSNIGGKRFIHRGEMCQNRRGIVAKKRDPGILDPELFLAQIRKVEARLGKLAKIRKVETN